MYKAILFMGFLGSFFSCWSQKTTNQNDLAGFIQTKGDSLLKKEALPGIFVAVLNKGQQQFYNFGYAIPEQKIPFDANTLFEAGSITKTFTAFIVESVLHEKGIPDTASILSFLPDSVQTNKALASVTFRSLLNHTSGLPRLPDNMPLVEIDMAPYDKYTEKELFAYLKMAQSKPDGKSNYSNLGMGLAGVLVQKMTGKDYNSLLQQYIFTPFGIDQKNSSGKSQGYFQTGKAAFWQMAALAPAGGIKTTAQQLLTYLRQMSKPSNNAAKTIIAQLLEPTARISPVVRIAKGWHTIEQQGKPIIYWHNGGTYGFSTFAAFIKDTEQAVIVVVNRFNANQFSDGLGVSIMKKMLD